MSIQGQKEGWSFSQLSRGKTYGAPQCLLLLQYECQSILWKDTEPWVVPDGFQSVNVCEC